MTTEAFIGLMSGTSLDGVDGVLAEFSQQGGVQVLAHRHEPFTATLRAELLALNSSGPNELHRAALAANALARLYADTVAALVSRLGNEAPAVRAIGAHGQTVRHQPGPVDGSGYTLQINAPALLAELTGLDVIADFRSRDVAAGGHGAPLVPAFHEAVFARPDRRVAVLNLGGIANLSLLQPGQPTTGFDCGPANVLMDLWCERHRNEAFDAGGRWAASGTVDAALLREFLSEPYFAEPAPKSTGRDLFDAAWLDARLGRHATKTADVMATLSALTLRSVCDALATCGGHWHELLVCGGGAANTHLMHQLALALPATSVLPTDVRGLPASQVEATAFAWLAHAFVQRRPGNLVSVTGARGPRVLGALYPAG